MSDIPLARDVEYEITRMLRRSRARSMRTVADVHPDLELGNYLLLLAVDDACGPGSDGVRATELAESFAVHKSTVSRGLATLEQIGLVERVPDPTDGRARLVRLTDEAARRVEEVRRRRHEQLAAVLEDWQSDDLTTLARLLDQLNNALDQG
ncbi:MarR family transcriptional regulator [Nocardioidaceae bacterium SCSIO 66511]|nr:MarR family transcriptional regulator [Nocardioidaceae bacterium SCSIO 66511]